MGAGAAPRGVASLAERDHARPRACPGACCARRRRAPDDRPAPRRPAAARRGDRRAAGTRGADGLAAPADRRGGRRHGRRGAQPAAGVRCRGGAGAHDPPQQGPRVPDRLSARTCGRPCGSRDDPCRSSSTTPMPATGGRSTSRSRARLHTPSRAQPRSSAARTCGSLYVALTRARHQAVVWWAGSFDSRNSALGRLLFSRDDGRRRARRGRDAVRRRRDRALRAARRAGARMRRASSAPRSGWRPVERAADRPAELGVRLASTGRSTRAGGAPPTATSPPARTRRASRASPRRAVPEPTRGARRPRRPRRGAGATRTPTTRLLGGRRRCLARCRRARGSARSSTACSRRPTSPPPTSTPS